MKAAVVVPLYKTTRTKLWWFEPISLRRCFEVFGGRHPIVFIVPEGWSCDYLPSRSDYSIETFDPKYFKGTAGYNTLMLSPQFYQRFTDYDYILIYQLDAFVFSDRLEEFCELGYDYIGAPWPYATIGVRLRLPVKVSVGNGGFSLRNVKSCINVLLNHSDWIASHHYQEDNTYSCLGTLPPNDFRVAPLKIASRFSAEDLPERYCRKNENVLPFGCHGWFIRSAKFYERAFSEVGYDLTLFESVMGNIDIASLNASLRDYAFRRLIKRFNKGRSLRRYLPPNEKFFVCLADGQSNILADRLYAEGLQIINPNAIPFLVNDEQMRAAAELRNRSSTRGLILSLTDDSPLISKLINMNGGGAVRAILYLVLAGVHEGRSRVAQTNEPTVDQTLATKIISARIEFKKIVLEIEDFFISVWRHLPNRLCRCIFQARLSQSAHNSYRCPPQDTPHQSASTNHRGKSSRRR